MKEFKEYPHVRLLMMTKRVQANIEGLRDIQAQIPYGSSYSHRDTFFSSGWKCQDLSDKLWFQDNSRQEFVVGLFMSLWSYG